MIINGVDVHRKTRGWIKKDGNRERSSWSPVALPYDVILSHIEMKGITCHTTAFVKRKDTAFDSNPNNLLMPCNYPFPFLQNSVISRFWGLFFPRNLLSNTSQIITQQTRRRTKRPSLSCHCWQINRLFHRNTLRSPAALLPEVKKDFFFSPKWWKKGKNMTTLSLQ